MQTRQSSNPFAGIIAILFVVFLIWLIFNFLKGVFSILSLLALPLFILALVFNYSVVTDYFKWVFNFFKTDIVKGLLATGATVIGYPLVSAYLFFKAFSTRKFGKKKEEKGPGDYIKYEEVEEDFLELPETPGEKVKQTRSQNNYDDLFNG